MIVFVETMAVMWNNSILPNPRSSYNVPKKKKFIIAASENATILPPQSCDNGFRKAHKHNVCAYDIVTMSQKLSRVPSYLCVVVISCGD